MGSHLGLLLFSLLPRPTLLAACPPPPPPKGLSFRKPQALAPWHSQPHPTPALKVRVRSGAREGPHPLLLAHLGPDWSPGAPPLPELSRIIIGAFKFGPATLWVGAACLAASTLQTEAPFRASFDLPETRVGRFHPCCPSQGKLCNPERLPQRSPHGGGGGRRQNSEFTSYFFFQHHGTCRVIAPQPED